MVDDTFHPFPRLPLELREEIWRLCLPHLVYELDDVIAAEVYSVLEPEEDNIPCWLYSTSKSNNRPPLLTRICRESRRVAFATGKWVSRLDWRGAGSFDGPREADWNTGNVIDRGYWENTFGDTIHLNWTSLYDIEYGPRIDGHPLTLLAQETKRLNGSASFMLDAMLDELGEREPYDKPLSRWFDNIPVRKGKQEDLAALKLLPEWMVVVRVVVIHLDLGRAADSGLFGLLGDEIIQVVDATLPLASQLYALAEHCERGASAVKAAQDFTRMSADDMDAMVKRVAFKVFHDSEVGKRLRPAIMFRLSSSIREDVLELMPLVPTTPQQQPSRTAQTKDSSRKRKRMESVDPIPAHSDSEPIGDMNGQNTSLRSRGGTTRIIKLRGHRIIEPMTPLGESPDADLSQLLDNIPFSSFDNADGALVDAPSKTPACDGPEFARLFARFDEIHAYLEKHGTSSTQLVRNCCDSCREYAVRALACLKADLVPSGAGLEQVSKHTFGKGKTVVTQKRSEPTKRPTPYLQKYNRLLRVIEDSSDEENEEITS